MMKITMIKYCIMTEDLKQVEVGQSRNYHFIPIEELEKSKSKIQLFNSYKVAKSSFLRSWYGIKWDEEKQMFINEFGCNYVIKKLTITYDIDLNKENNEYVYRKEPLKEININENKPNENNVSEEQLEKLLKEVEPKKKEDDLEEDDLPFAISKEQLKELNNG